MLRIAKSSRVLIEVGGTLTVCSLIDGGVEFKNEEQVERINQSLQPLIDQQESMDYEYAALLKDLDASLVRYLEETLGSAGSANGSRHTATQKNGSGKFSTSTSANHSHAHTNNQTPTRDWKELIDSVLPLSERDMGLRREAEAYTSSLNPHKFQEKYRTVKSEDVVKLMNFYQLEGPLSLVPGLSRVKLRDYPVTTDEKNNNNSNNKTATNKNKTTASSSLSGEQEFLKVLDALAVHAQKVKTVKDRGVIVYDLLDAEFEKREEEATPREALHTTTMRLLAQLLGSSLLLMLTRRVLPLTAPSVPLAAAAAESLSPYEKFTKRLGVPRSLALFTAGVFSLGAVLQASISLSNYLTTQPLTSLLMQYLGEYAAEREEERIEEIEASGFDPEVVLEMEEDRAEDKRLHYWLTTPAPAPQIWPGNTEKDPFRMEKLFLYTVVQPACEVVLFYKRLLPSLLSFLSPAVAHAWTMIAFAFYRDHSMNPQQAFMRLPAVESFVHSLASSALAQGQLSLFSFATIPFLSKATESFFFALSEFSTPGFAVNKERLFTVGLGAFQAMQGQAIAFLSFARVADKEAAEKILSTVGGINTFTGLFSPSVTPLLGALARYTEPTQKQTGGAVLRAEWRECLERVMDTFSSDHFSERRARRMSTDDAVDFLVALWALFDKGRERDGHWQRVLGGNPLLLKDLLCDTSGHGKWTTEASRVALREMKDKLNLTAQKQKEEKEKNDTRRTHIDTDSNKDEERGAAADVDSVTLSVAEQVLREEETSTELLAQSILVNGMKVLFPKGLSHKDFELLFLYALCHIDVQLQRERAREEKDSKRSTTTLREKRLSAEILPDLLSVWENADNERFLDLTQTHMENLLRGQTLSLRLYEPLLFAPFAQRLAGRMPTKKEGSEYISEIGQHIQLSRYRASVASLYREGLTPHRWQTLLQRNLEREKVNNNSSTPGELAELLRSWNTFFVSPLMNKKLLESIENTEQRRDIYGLRFLKHVRLSVPVPLEDKSKEGK